MSNITTKQSVLPDSKQRAFVTPAKRSKGSQHKVPDETRDQASAERRSAMTRAQRLKRVFNIDIDVCQSCGGAMKVIASTEDPVVIHKILDYLDSKTAVSNSFLLPDNRAPPQADLFHRLAARDCGVF